MLHIILLVLKILVFLVLAVLGLLLLALLLVLLAPVRYLVQGTYDGKPKGQARVTWLLHILWVKAEYDQGLALTARIFGIRVFRTKPEDLDEPGSLDGTEGLDEPEDLDGTEGLDESEGLDGTEGQMEVLTGQELSGPARPAQEEDGEENLAEPEHMIREEPTSPSSKARLGRFQSFFQMAKKRLKRLKGKKDQVVSWIQDPGNRKMVELAWRQFKKIIKHLLPRKARGKVTFGFEDPYVTGQVLQALSLAYPFCHKQLDIYPVFDRNMLEGEGCFKGRIRMGTLLACGIRLYMNKNFRALIKKLLLK